MSKDKYTIALIPLKLSYIPCEKVHPLALFLLNKNSVHKIIKPLYKCTTLQSFLYIYFKVYEFLTLNISNLHLKYDNIHYLQVLHPENQ